MPCLPTGVPTNLARYEPATSWERTKGSRSPRGKRTGNAIGRHHENNHSCTRKNHLKMSSTIQPVRLSLLFNRLLWPSQAETKQKLLPLWISAAVPRAAIGSLSAIALVEQMLHLEDCSWKPPEHVWSIPNLGGARNANPWGMSFSESLVVTCIFDLTLRSWIWNRLEPQWNQVFPPPVQAK